MSEKKEIISSVTHNYGKELENRLIAILRKAFPQSDGWKLKANIPVKIPLAGKIDVDFLVEKQGESKVVIEFLYNIRTQSLDRTFTRVSYMGQALSAPICLVCSSDYVWLVKDKKPESKIELSVDNIKSLYSKEKDLLNGFQDVDKQTVKNSWKKIVDETEELPDEKKSSLNSVIDGLSEIHNEEDTFNLDQEWEDKFFKALIGADYNKETVCRHTSFYSIFRTCNEGRQSLCSVVCMNDVSEINYVTNYCDHAELYSTENTNGCYIMSCTTPDKMNDFTMIRLYGDNAKGVCLEYKVEKELLSNFFLVPVNYAKDETCHPELDLLKKLMNEKINNRKIVFKRLYIWEHFFKSYEYKDEEEIRLLYISKVNDNEGDDYGDTQEPPFKRKWIYDENYGIISPIVTFDITNKTPEKDRFPLTLKKIILGPLVRESKINKDQLLSIIKAKGISYISNVDEDLVEISKIKSYR